MKTRSSTDIIGLILEAAAGEPATRSKIMYQAMLNFKQVSDYAEFLTRAGLLRHIGENRQYGITEKGRQFLSLFREANGLLRIANSNSNNNNNNNPVDEQEPRSARSLLRQ